MQRIILFITLLLSVSLYAQQDYEAQQKKLESQKASILKEIKQFQSMLSSEKRKERDILREITESNRKISLTNQLISTYKKELRVLADDIYTKTLESNKLKRELAVLKEDYAKTIRTSYKTRSEQSKILFVLSSDSFLQAYKRMQYIKQYAKYRKSQGEEIRKKSEDLEKIMQKLEVQKQKQQAALAEQQKEITALQQEKNKQNELMSLVRKDQKKYTSQINKKQQESRKIDQQIKVLIQKAIEEANRKAREKEGGSSTEKVSSGKFAMTPAEKALAASFSNNRGRLPWPVERGYISGRYGSQPHPSVPNITIENHGVDITTENQATVRAVFEGEVTEIQILAGTRVVFVRHGDYISVYQNLSSVSVKQGQKVSTKQTIGTVAQNREGQSVLKFYLTQNNQFQNPQSWLSGK
ncbi:murein hydrolase activator EnvC family protein [Avrilella dinanensis]|uniref:murein hydrolase activator EnvC family protein n=1 Tax=Avrilella dinanensis TaxID=2008672 RepID=UPI0024097659|nr:peptidoglycan DD-metalloendopeptidase family protein [Avrilella dinanensis]